MTKIKIGIDIGPLTDGNKDRGVGFYVQNLLDALKKYDYLEIIEGHTVDDFKNVDLIHYPSFDLFKRTLPINKLKPVVVTIHDVTPLVYPKAYPAGIMGSINLAIQKHSLKNVKAVITDSNASAIDLAKYLGIKKTLIHLVYLSAGDEFKRLKDKTKISLVKDKYNLPDKFVVYIGNVNWNKNILRMAEAAVKMNVCMVFVGKGFEDHDPKDHVELKEYKEFLRKYGENKDIKRIGFVPSGDLVGILSLSSVCFFASIYEGFGLPILEAQSCGVPVITSRSSSMPEVAGEGALYVDPFNVEEMTEALNKVLSDNVLSARLVAKGHENIKKFSWEKTAAMTIGVYSSVLKLDLSH